MNFLWAGGPSKQHEKADEAFLSPTSLTSQRLRPRIASQSPSASQRSFQTYQKLSPRNDSGSNDPIVADIVYSTKVLSVKEAPSVDSVNSSQRGVAKTRQSTRSRSLPPVIESHASFPLQRSVVSQIDNPQKKQEVVQDELTDAIEALSNADSVIAKAADSFKKTFDFIAKTLDTGKNDAPMSPSTVSTRPETPPMSPISPSETSAQYLEIQPSPNSMILYPSQNQVVSVNSGGYDPIMETRSILSSSTVPDLHLVPSAVSASSSKSTGLSRIWHGRSLKGNITPDCASSTSTSHYDMARIGAPQCNELNARSVSPLSMEERTTRDCTDTAQESAAANRERALLKLQDSLSNLGNALSTAAWGTVAMKKSDIPSLLQNSSTAPSLEESFDPALFAKETPASSSVNRSSKLATVPGKDANRAGCSERESFQSGYTSNSVERALVTDAGGLGLHDSLSILPSYAFESAWMSYCDLPSLLQSQSSTLSIEATQEPVIPSEYSACGTPMPSYVKHDGNECVLVTKDPPSDSEPMTIALGENNKSEQVQFETEGLLSHEEAIVQMQASLGNFMSTVQSSLLGKEDDVIQKALEAGSPVGRQKLSPSSPISERRKQKALAIGRTGARKELPTPSPASEGQKPRSLEHDEESDFAGDRNRVGLEPEGQTDFRVDELVMKVENEKVTCTADDSYEVLSQTKYYPVEVTSSGVNSPMREEATPSQCESSEYVTFTDELVERHIQASFYLEDPLVDTSLGQGVVTTANSNELVFIGTGTTHSSRESEKEEDHAHSPFIHVVDEITEKPIVRTRGEDPPGLGPWPISCMEPFYGGTTEGSLTSSNFVFCHQSPQELSDTLNASLLELGSHVQRLDEEHHVSENMSRSVSEIGSALTSIWKQADQALGVSATTKQVSTVLKETAKHPPKPEDFQRHLQQLDEDNRFIEHTASVVAEGAQYLARSIETMATGPSKSGALITAV